MKNLLYFLLLSLPFCLAAQPKIKRWSVSVLNNGTWQATGLIDYTYNEQGLATSETNYNFIDGKQTVYYQLLNDYAADGQLLRSEYYQKYPDSVGTYLQTTRDFEPGPEGCQNSVWINVWQPSGYFSYATNTEYFRSQGCQLDSMVTYWCDSTGLEQNCDFSEYSAYRYDANGNLTIEHQGAWDWQTGQILRYDSVNTWEYDAENRLVERNYRSRFGDKARWLYTYHPDGTLHTETQLYPDSTGAWELYLRRTLEYEYGPTGFLEKKLEDVDWPGINYAYAVTYNYFNYCDGRPRIELINDYTRYTYEYTEGVDCDGNWFNEQPEVHPNPASDMLSVHWPYLEQGKTRIGLYTALGSEVTDLPISYRTHEVELDVSNLATGIYFLRITDGKKKFGKKILVQQP